MSKCKQTSRFTTEVVIHSEPMTQEDWKQAQTLLARLLAAAYLADHPELFQNQPAANSC